MRKKVVKEDTYNDCWLYILLLTTLVILMQSLKTYEFDFYGSLISFSIFLLPFVYLINNYIFKKYDYKKASASIAISGVISVCFMVIMDFALGRNVNLSTVSGEFCGYVVSQFVNLTIYVFLYNNTKAPFVLILANYLFAIVVYYLFYTLIYLDVFIIGNYWFKYLSILLIDFIMAIPIAFIDSKIKRGV